MWCVGHDECGFKHLQGSCSSPLPPLGCMVRRLEDDLTPQGHPPLLCATRLDVHGCPPTFSKEKHTCPSASARSMSTSARIRDKVDGAIVGVELRVTLLPMLPSSLMPLLIARLRR